MNCVNCRYGLPKEAKFCPECGQKVIITEQLPGDKKAGSTNKTASFSKPVHAFGLIIAAIAAAILIVVLILDSNQQAIEEKREISSNTTEMPAEIKAQLEKLSADPESLSLNIETGNLLFDNGLFDEAIPFYQKALKIDSLNIGVQIDLAVCYFNLRNSEQAILEMKKALKIDPNHPKGLFNLGIIYYNLGMFEEVRKYWEKLMVIHPDSMEAARARELLQNIDN
jgi:tetratricopeptide (TPR) repeat protein